MGNVLGASLVYALFKIRRTGVGEKGCGTWSETEMPGALAACAKA